MSHIVYRKPSLNAEGPTPERMSMVLHLAHEDASPPESSQRERDLHIYQYLSGTHPHFGPGLSIHPSATIPFLVNFHCLNKRPFGPIVPIVPSDA
jgi:hypothetical protein